MQARFLSQEDPLEEGMATHSSILSWRIPWMEEPGRLWSIGSQRARSDWSYLAHTQHTHGHFPPLPLQKPPLQSLQAPFSRACFQHATFFSLFFELAHNRRIFKKHFISIISLQQLPTFWQIMFLLTHPTSFPSPLVIPLNLKSDQVTFFAHNFLRVSELRKMRRNSNIFNGPYCFYNFLSLALYYLITLLTLHQPLAPLLKHLGLLPP